MKKYCFNLVEIMLAVVILSLGMTSVFVLFPAGLSNHRNAMAENSVADIAELIFSRVRAESALAVNYDGFSPDVNDFPVRKDCYNDNGSGDLKEPEGGLDWEDGLSDDEPWTWKKVDKGLYMVRQVSGPAGDHFVDFSAVVAVYKDDDNDFGKELFIPTKWGGNEKVFNSDDIDKSKSGDTTADVKELELDKFIMPLVMEISYPAELPYKDREKAYFRFEIFNDKYELKQRDGGVTP